MKRLFVRYSNSDYRWATRQWPQDNRSRIENTYKDADVKISNDKKIKLSTL